MSRLATLERWLRPIGRRLPMPVREPLRRWWLKFRYSGVTLTGDYGDRLAQEQSIFSAQDDLQQLPGIYHYWSNRHLRPMLEAEGFSYPEDFFARAIEARASALRRPLSIISLGCGDGDSEVRIASLLRERGVTDFSLECFDLNAGLLERAAKRAQDAGVAAFLTYSQGDLNRWQPKRRYDVVMANQSLHHVLELEALFDAVRESLEADGVFAISDMIGRNGHMRWPEAMAIVQEFWREIPPERRYNVQLRRFEREYQDWDCSGEGFEGIRAQDILPLLIERFGFELFIGFGNVIDPFIDRAFGSNFDPASERDREFIDRIHARDEAEMLAGRITPTHMLGLLRRERDIATRCYKHLTPGFCVRRAQPMPGADASPTGTAASPANTDASGPGPAILAPAPDQQPVCPICHRHAPEPTVVGTVATTHPGPFEVSEYRLVHCPVCDVVRLDPPPSDADLCTLYQRSVQFADAHYTDEIQIARILAYYGSCLDNHALLPGPGEASLEVGAGWAWVSRACKLRSAAVRTVAQDVTAECAGRCPWVDQYVVGEVGSIPQELRFKLISLTHVIEHLVDPQAMLLDLAARLERGGRILVTAPYRPVAWRVGGGIDAWRAYSYLHVPAHVSYLSKKWFELSAARCGLQLLRWDPSHEDGQAFEVVLGRD
jgi:2-polyprenyl-3-methyl-5-hydroxy-6-metoxy-1,4-benzoquinol methylase